ncbi:MAG: MBL fold metallo-hydrolase, partial [Rhizobiaceae bacterium]|nr:MBL fold metallo-hydrolase [Rhizobiaceae bacterium]
PGLFTLTEPHLNAVFRANLYFMQGRDRDLLVDAGMGLAPLTPALPITPGKPLLAVATHVHADHVGSLHEFSDRAGPRAEAEAFATMDDAATYADWFRAMDDPVSALPHAGWNAATYAIEPARLGRLLEEGDRIDLGDRRFSVLALPGHSPGCIGLYDEADGLLFSGDAIYDDELYDQLPCSDLGDYRRTMRRLTELPVSIVHGGHGPSFGQSRMRAIAEAYLRR